MQTAPSAASVSRDRDSLLVDLALQGGGAHGTYTWGVLDRLLEQPWLQIDGISGTSAGAMNAAALDIPWMGTTVPAPCWRPSGDPSQRRVRSARSSARHSMFF